MSQTINNGSTNAPIIYRDTNLTNVAVGVVTTPAELTGYTITNSNTSDAYVKFYNTSSGSTTVGTTTVVRTVHVPSQTTIVAKEPKGSSMQYFSTAMTIAGVTGLADTNTTAPTTGLYIEVYYNKSTA